MESLISFNNLTNHSADSVQIQFTPTRTEIQNLTSDLGLVTRVSDFAFMLHFTIPLGHETKGQVKVTYTGEPVSLNYVNFPSPIEHVELKSLRVALDKPANFDADLIHVNFQKRMAYIASIPNPIVKKAQEFFAFYDHQSLPPLVERNPELSAVEKAKRIRIVMSAVGVLTDRVLIRGKYGAKKQIPPVAEMPNLEIESITYLSELQKDIFNKHYLTNDILDLNGIEAAFEMFTNGDLRLIDSLGIRNGEPDSAFEFSFAEWALLAIQNNVDVDYWKQIAPKLIKSQLIFMQVYQPNESAPYSYDEYLSNNYRKDKKVSDVFRDQLREEYSKMTFDECVVAMGQNAFNAFTGNYIPTI